MKIGNFKFRHYDKRLEEMRYSHLHDGEFYVNTKGVLYMYMIPETKEYYKSYDVDICSNAVDSTFSEIWQNDTLLSEGVEYTIKLVDGCLGMYTQDVDNIFLPLTEWNLSLFKKIGTVYEKRNNSRSSE